MVADEGQTPVIAHGHWHRSGFSTVEEYREQMAALEGVQLTGDSYGYGRVPSLQDRFPGVG